MVNVCNTRSGFVSPNRWESCIIFSLQLYGVCPWTSNDVEGSESVLTVVTELGKAMNVIKLIQIPWDDRLRVG